MEEKQEVKQGKKQKKGILDYLFMETPLTVAVAIATVISGIMFYFLVPTPPRVIFSFDAEKFQKDLVARASLAQSSIPTISMITSELRKTLDSYAVRYQTFVINRRALISDGIPNVKVVNITKQVEEELFPKYIPEAQMKMGLNKLLSGKSNGVGKGGN